MSVTEPEPRGLRSALLLGSDHTELGEIAIEELAPNLAVGISRGRFRKGYPHVDPNEDAVFASTDGSTTILAVADGHGGFDAARGAISGVAEEKGPTVGQPLDSIVERLHTAATAGVADATRGLPQTREASGTSLTVVAVRAGKVASATLGDSACFIVTQRRATRIGATTAFLSARAEFAVVRVEVGTIPEHGMVVVTSDGLLDFTSGTDRLLRSVVGLRGRDGVERLLDAAFAGGAGDNLSIGSYRQL